MLAALLKNECFAKHQEWLASATVLRRAVADVLLQCCLPAVAATASALATADMQGRRKLLDVLQALPGLLLHPSLAPALRQRLQGPGAPAAVQAAVEVVEALPLPRPPGMAAAQFESLHGHAMQLLNACTIRMAGAADQEGGSSGAAAAGPAHGCSTTAAADQASISSHQRLTAWRLVAVVPRLASIIQALADDPDAATAYPGNPSTWLANLGSACANLSSVLGVLHRLKQRPATPAELASWAAAAAPAGAAGRQLQQLSRQHGDPESVIEGAARLSRSLFQDLGQSTPILHQYWAAATFGSEAAQRSLAFGLWELHGTAARLRHFYVSRGSTALASASAAVSHTEQWPMLAYQLARIFHCALHALLAWKLAGPATDTVFR